MGLREVNGSGFTGIAVLSPNPTDPATTDVSVFIASDLSGSGVWQRLRLRARLTQQYSARVKRRAV